MELSEILGSDNVFGPVKVQGKKRLLQEIAASAQDVLGLDESIAFRALLERESLGPTGVGNGVAIPHARIEGLTEVKGLFFVLDQPIEFESVDRKPVDLVFALFAPQKAGAEHLKALARVSRTLRSEDICNKLRSTEDASAIHAILCDASAPQAA
ncbi:PTS sugar transporter subunit IIA [Halovulum sp. GXIMD14793]